MGKYQFPAYKLLSDYSKEKLPDQRNYEQDKQNLNQLFKDYNISASVSEILQAPKHILFKVYVKNGQSVSSVFELKNEIKVVLKSQDIDFEWPLSEDQNIGVILYRNIAQTGIVGLKDIIKSDEFQNYDGYASFPLGKDLEGNILMTDLAQVPHLLIAGTTGSGKSVLVDSMITSMLYKYTPDDLQFVLLQTRKGTFDFFEGIPHLHQPLQTGEGQVFLAFEYLEKLMHERLNIMTQKHARSLYSYNNMTSSYKNLMSRIIVVVDDIYDLMNYDAKRLKKDVKIMASMARATGIHFVFITQYPDSDVLDGQVVSNLVGRAAFHTASAKDSRMIINEPGAERLTQIGDFYYYEPGLYFSRHLQAPYISSEEIKRVVESIK